MSLTIGSRRVIPDRSGPALRERPGVREAGVRAGPARHGQGLGRGHGRKLLGGERRDVRDPGLDPAAGQAHARRGRPRLDAQLRRLPLRPRPGRRRHARPRRAPVPDLSPLAPAGLPARAAGPRSPGLSDGPRERLVAALREHALVIGEVTLTSGKKAQYYVDAKRAILRRDGFQALGDLVADQARQLRATAVGGMTMGADPIACAALAGGAEVNAFFVRKERKEHGLQRWIEGPDLAP